MNRIKHVGWASASWDSTISFIVSVSLPQNKTERRWRWMFVHLVPGLGLECATEIHSKPSSPSPNKQPIQTKEILFTFTHPPHPTSHTLLAYEALSVMFLSRFPSLSIHKAWERHKEEADTGARGSLELFWPVKVTEMWHATWAKIPSQSSLRSCRTPSTRQWQGGKEDIVSA